MNANFGRLWMERRGEEKKKKDYIQLFYVKSSSVFVRGISLNFCIWAERERKREREREREREGEFLPRGFLSTRNVDVIEGRRGKLMALTVWEIRKGIYRSFECTSRAETSSIFQRRGGGGGEKKGKKKGTESNKETRSLETEREG